VGGRFTPFARRDFLRAIERIREDNPRAARALRKQAARSLRRLERFPNSGRKIPEFPALPHREVVVPPYRFFYRAAGKTVWVVAVWHGAQLPDEPAT